MTIYKEIKSLINSKRVLFTTPSHDGTNLVIPACNRFIGKNFYKHDISEVNGLDNLSEPQGCILKAMQKSAELIGVDKVFYLTNGSTSGILASILYSLKEGDNVLVARNCHKSTVNGLILSGANPTWVFPKINRDWGIFEAIEPAEIEKEINKNNNIKAVIITSPTYEGVNSDIKAIAKICHKYGVILIVDEAHGALKSFSSKYFGENAVKLGADISVQSLHKTCGAINPSAIMLCNKNINMKIMQNAINLVNTTSPSFPTIANIEETINFLFSKKGQITIEKLFNNISQFKENIFQTDNIEVCRFNDISKILVKIKGLSGYILSDILYKEYNIEDELTNNKASLFLTGTGTKKQKLKVLEKALKEISQQKYQTENEEKKGEEIIIPQTIISPREAFFADKKELTKNQAENKICAEIITKYPPGIPILVPGEKISKEHIQEIDFQTKILCSVNDK